MATYVVVSIGSGHGLLPDDTKPSTESKLTWDYWERWSYMSSKIIFFFFLVQVMACCLKAPSHYLNQCWLIITKVQWCSSEGNFARDITAISYLNWLEKFFFLRVYRNLPRANELNSWALSVKLLSGECHRTITAPSHYLRQCWPRSTSALGHNESTNTFIISVVDATVYKALQVMSTMLH